MTTNQTQQLTAGYELIISKQKEEIKQLQGYITKLKDHIISQEGYLPTNLIR